MGAESLDGWKPTRAAGNDNEEPDLSLLQQEGPEADAAREELRAVLEHFQKLEGTTPTDREPNTFPETADNAGVEAGEDRVRTEEAVRGAQQDKEVNNREIGEKLPGYDVMARTIREDLAAEQNIANFDEEREKRTGT